MIPSKDGQQIPLTLIYPTKIKKNRKNKLLLHVYGFYGTPLLVNYNHVYLQALQNNWIMAYAHIRGGNQKGDQWHLQAKQNRTLSFQDVYDCASYLIANGYTHPSLLTLFGSSAGSIICFNCIHHYNYLFKACILHIPFLDVLNTLLDTTLQLTVSDHQQFGNPTNNKKIFQYIKSFCPFQNINAKQYPAIMIMAAENDYKCQLYQILKFINKFKRIANNPIRCNQFVQKNIVLKIMQQSSHQGDISNLKTIDHNSQMIAFLEYVLYCQNKQIKVNQQIQVQIKVIQ